MAGFAKKRLPQLEFRLFKRPMEMIGAIRAEKPDVVGLSYYVWNANLNNYVAEVAKRANPAVLTVGGGPNITDLNCDEEHVRAFFSYQRHVDGYVLNQGERGFAALMQRLVELGGDVSKLRRDPVDGCLINDLAGADEVRLGAHLDPLRELDEIPSPYLTGAIDPFFDDVIIPIIETNRSCPYRCTFCAWGIGTGKLAKFSDERVLAEIEYIARRCTKTSNLYIADANYAVLDRDERFSAKFKECQDRYGYPGHVMAQWNKSRPDRVLKTARAMGGLGEVGASMQSLTPAVLDAIKRRNLPLKAVADLVKSLVDEGHASSLFSELIVGLPMETWQSHVDSIRQLMDVGAEVFNYNLHLLPGTEMETKESRQKYIRRTGWRLHDNAFGLYDGVKIFEGQEVVLETSTMPVRELRSFRFIHFLLQFMWGRRWYFDYLMLFKNVGLHPLDVVLRLADSFTRADGEMGALYRDFCADHDLENFTTYEDLCSYWSDPRAFDRLRKGDYGKLNYVFTYRIILKDLAAFNEFLRQNSEQLAGEILSADERRKFMVLCDAVLAFSQELRISFTKSLDLVDKKRVSFGFDVLAWRRDTHKGLPSPVRSDNPLEYEFYLPPEQRQHLQRQLAQLRSENLNLTLRKMSEDTSASQFFYQVREVNNPAYVR